jgi:hypothetical protein
MADTLEEMVEVVKGFVGDSGTCSNEIAAKAINDARRLLWNKREWNTTAEYVEICCADRCFTLPNRYEQIRLAWINGNSASLADEWFNAVAGNKLYNRASSCHALITEIGGKHIVYQEYNSAPYQIALLAEDIRDVGVTLTFEAQDEYSTYHIAKVTTVTPPTKGLSNLRFKALRAVSKPKTQGRIRVYAYNPDSDSSLLLSIYQPNDVNPTFRRFRIPKSANAITLYATKKFYELSDGQEQVEFCSEAMISAVAALNSRDNRKTEEFLKNLDIAIKEQEKEMEGDEIPTAAPLRIADYRRPENLIGDYFGSPSSNDYFIQPSWPI